MSGHSKWSTIKHKKESKDQKRGLLFSKLSSDIAAAVQEGGSTDPNQNPRLRTVLNKARAANMPADNVARAIGRGSGKGTGKDLEEVVYEGYGPAGVAIVAVAKTDNRQRTGATIKNILEQAGGGLGAPGSAMYLFERKGGGFAAKVELPINEERLREKLAAVVNQLASQFDISAVYTNALM